VSHLEELMKDVQALLGVSRREALYMIMKALKQRGDI